MTDISATTWTPFAVNNNAAAPNGFAENDLPSVVDDWGRETMAGVRRAWERTNATITTTGAAGHYIYSTVNNSFPNAYVQGEVYSFKADKDAVGFDDFVVNALGAKPLYIATSTGIIPIGPTQLKSGQIVSAVYDSALNTGGGGFQVIGVIPSSIVPTGGGTWQVGNIAFADVTYGLGQDPNLFWDQTNHRLGIGTTPRAPIDVFAAGSIFGQAGGNSAGPSATNTNILLYFNNSGNWAGMGAHTDGSMYWANGTGGVATRMVLQTNTGNLGVGNLTPVFKVDVTGDINTTANYRVSGRPFAFANGNYNQLYDATGNDAILLGYAGDQTNYYRNTTHVFGSIHGTTSYSTMSAAGLRILTNTSGALQIDNGSGGNLFRFAANNVPDTSCPSARSDGTNLVFNAHPSGGLYLNNDISGGNVYVLGNANFGVAGGSSNWRTFIQGIGTTSTTYQLVCDNSVGAGCLWVRDDGVVSMPSYANGTLQISTGSIVSVTNPTFGSTTTGNLQCNGNFLATGNVTSNAAVNTTLYQLRGINFADTVLSTGGGTPTYNRLYDGDGHLSIFLGGGSDPENYYRNTTHVFGSINQSTLYGTWGAAGVNVDAGNLSVNAGGISCTGAISCGSITASSLATGGGNIQTTNITANTLTLTAGGTALFADNGDIRAHGNLIADGNVTTNATVAFTGVGSSFVGYNGVDQNIALAGFDANNYLLVASATRNLVLNFDAGNFALYNGNGSSMSFSSDRKLKENIKSLTPNHVNKDADSFVGLLGQLNPVKFNFKADDDKKEQIGLIAQDVQEVFPHLVSEHDSTLGLAYGGLVVPLIAAVKELNDRLAKLEAKSPKPAKKP